jgi:hypothetical protein
VPTTKLLRGFNHFKTSYRAAGTKHRPFGFQAGLRRARPALLRGFCFRRSALFGRCAPNGIGYEARSNVRALGDERLSGKKGSDGKDGGGKNPPKPPKSPRKTSGSNDIGRALRSAYDDTVREAVPDEFMDLLGKLG